MIDSRNKFKVAVLVGDGDKDIRICDPRVMLTNEEALNLAAWLVALADPDGDRFQEILCKVKET